MHFYETSPAQAPSTLQLVQNHLTVQEKDSDRFGKTRLLKEQIYRTHLTKNESENF